VVAKSLREFLDEGRALVDGALARCLPVPPACPPILSEALRYCVFAGGKRLRPMLVLAAADAVSRSSEARTLALPAACAVELIHTYSLIHDDLPSMDNDTLRRGRPTLHVVYGEGIAVLAGDALQAEAFALLAREPVTDDAAIAGRKLRVLHMIAAAAGASGMVGGQAIDLQAAGQTPGDRLLLDEDGLQAMHQRKTGALIRASAVSGAVLGGASDAVVDAVDRWAAQIGLAFQIVDDILDVEGNASQLGKTAGKDAAGQKPTYPAVFGLERSRALAAECADRARAVLGEAELSDGWLGDIADWVITRRT